MAIIKFHYKDPKEMSAFKTINEGEGFFKILEIISKKSKAGSDMQVITHKLRDTAGNETLYNQYLLHNEYLAENMWRICEAIGRPDLYKEEGVNTEDLLGCAGKCKIKTEENQYGKQSKIHRFIPYKPMQQRDSIEEVVAHSVDPLDEEIPF